MANLFNNDPFFNNNMDDLFNQISRQLGDGSTARYEVNGHELTPDEFAQYRATGKLPDREHEIEVNDAGDRAVKKGGILEKLGRNLTQEARDGLLDQ